MTSRHSSVRNFHFHRLPDGKSISGTWTQSKPLPLEFKRATAPIKTEHKPAKPSDIDGTWAGTLETGMSKLRVAFHIMNTEDGLIATMDSPDQGAKGIPTSSVTRNGAALKIEAKGIGGVFEGKIAADVSSIDGTWTQGGRTLPLVLKRVKDQAEVEHKAVTPSDIGANWRGHEPILNDAGASTASLTSLALTMLAARTRVQKDAYSAGWMSTATSSPEVT